jgi:hypothetical protein
MVREAIIAETLAHPSADPQTAADQGLLLFGTIGSSFHLLPDGSVWINEWDHDSTDPTAFRWRRATVQEEAGAFKVAAERRPIFAQLIPRPVPGTAACESCRGSGQLTRGATIMKGTWCDNCCGIGFLLEGAV